MVAPAVAVDSVAGVEVALFNEEPPLVAGGEILSEEGSALHHVRQEGRADGP